MFCWNLFPAFKWWIDLYLRIWPTQHKNVHFHGTKPFWAFFRVCFQFQSLWSERWLVYLCHHPSSTHHPLKMSENAEHADKNVEIWKVKKLIKSLEAARGNFLSSCVFLAGLYLGHYLVIRWIINCDVQAMAPPWSHSSSHLGTKHV